MTILAQRGYMEFAYLSEVPYHAGQIDDGLGMQVDRKLALSPEIGSQVDLALITTAATGMEVKAAPLQIIEHGSYLDGSDGYLSGAGYLLGIKCALQGMQVEGLIVENNFTGMQVEAFIIDDTDDKFTGMQVNIRIFDETRIGMQVDRNRVAPTGFQATMVLYNTTQLRILCAFPSRGTVALAGNNWTSPQGVEVGDFSLNNLNTDVLEQRTQSPSGVKALWEIRCDTGLSNTFVDTIAILEHNLTISATITFQGSDDPAFGAITISEVLTTEVDNMYFIALANVTSRIPSKPRAIPQSQTIELPGNSCSSHG